MDTKKEIQQELRFPIAESAEYQQAQNQEIRLGAEEGLDVSIYANPDFNWLQMEQIRIGLKDKVDVTAYANPAYSYDTMKQIRLSIYSEIDLLPYLRRGFTDDALEEIRLSLLNRLPIDDWLKDDMCAPQIFQIRVGLSEQLDVSAFADSKYNWKQMREIRLGVEKKLDTSLYANPLYSYFQMREIRLGLESGLDVSSYCGLVHSATDMRKRRLGMIDDKQSTKPVAEEAKAHRSARRPRRISQFDISIEENGNKAFAFIPRLADNAVTEEDIYRDLERRKIVFGVLPDAISDMIQKRKAGERVLIAEGIPAQKGADGWFEFYVRLDLPRIPAPLPDGGVDYANIEAFEMVDEGEEIAVYHPAGKGVDGTNIYGETIHAENGTEEPPLRGEGFTVAPDGVTYISKLNGKFEYVKGQIIITNMLVIREDVTAVTGKLEVDGSVYVIGSVYSGGYIKVTGDIIIEHNVETANLIAGGNIMIKKGSCSKHDCFIEAGGEVSGSFFEAASINAGGNVKANYIMNCYINTMGRVIVSGSKGVLLGGRICAVKGVDTFNLGNKSHIKTLLEIGRNSLYEKEQAVYAEKRERLMAELSALEKGWRKILRIPPAEREAQKELMRKIRTTILAKNQALADLDAEISKLANMTDQTMKLPVCVKGVAHEGAVIIINTMKFALNSEVKRVVFRLRNKKVVMVSI